MREESHELGALISKLRLGVDEMSFKTYIKMEGDEITELDLSIIHAAHGLFDIIGIFISIVERE